MKRTFFKLAALVLSLVMVLTMFSACGKDADPAVDEVVNAAVKAAVDAAVVPTTLIIKADGKEITFEDTEGKSVAQLLELVDITVNDGDLLTVTPDQTLTGKITVQILRRCTVSVVVTAEDQSSVRYTAVLTGGTVADALAALGLELTDNQVTNHDLGKALENGMEIVISVKEEEPAETEPTEPTEATEPDDSDSSSGSGSTPTTPPATTPTTPPATTPTTPPATTPTTPPATTPTVPPTEPPTTPPTTAPTEPERYVVSVEIYEDCDGSGHGVKIITYSDGTQEEVYF